MSSLLIIYTAYLVAAGSPGVSTMAIMNLAMKHGRRPAIAFACGVVTVSAIWGTASAAGMAALLHQFPQLLSALKILGGLYLLWLAAKALRIALAATAPLEQDVAPAPSNRALYRQGVVVHLANPKAVLAWTALFALGLGDSPSGGMLLLALLGCMILSGVVFIGYAVVFSFRPIAALYLRGQRVIEFALAAMFTAAGIRLLFSR